MVDKSGCIVLKPNYQNTSTHPALFSGRPRQGLNQVARKGGLELPAWRGGDFRSHRKPAGQPCGHRGQPVKARSRPNKSDQFQHHVSAQSLGVEPGRLKNRSQPTNNKKIRPYVMNT